MLSMAGSFIQTVSRLWEWRAFCYLYITAARFYEPSLPAMPCLAAGDAFFAAVFGTSGGDNMVGRFRYRTRAFCISLDVVLGT